MIKDFSAAAVQLRFFRMPKNEEGELIPTRLPRVLQPFQIGISECHAAERADIEKHLLGRTLRSAAVAGTFGSDFSSLHSASEFTRTDCAIWSLVTGPTIKIPTQIFNRESGNLVTRPAHTFDRLGFQPLLTAEEGCIVAYGNFKRDCEELNVKHFATYLQGEYLSKFGIEGDVYRHRQHQVPLSWGEHCLFFAPPAVFRRCD